MTPEGNPLTPFCIRTYNHKADSGNDRHPLTRSLLLLTGFTNQALRGEVPI